MRNYRFLPALCGILFFVVQVHADEEVIFHGKVTMEDGSPPGHLVTIQKACSGLGEPLRASLAAARTGEYIVRLDVNTLGQVTSGLDTFFPLPCMLQAEDHGYVSSRIDLSDRSITLNPRLPDIVLTPATHAVRDEPVHVPHAASRNWDLAIKNLTARNWAAAEAPLKSVTEAAPKFAAGWAALGTLYLNLRQPDEARRSLERAIEMDPKPLSPYLSLSNALIELKDWQAADATTRTFIAADKKHIYLEAYLLSAVAQYQLRNFDSALVQVNEAIRLDKLRQLGRAEYVLGLILEAKGDYPAAGQHMKTYVQQHPRAKDIAAVNDRLANLGKAPVADLSSEVTTADLRPVLTGESEVPGGIRAFSMVAQMASTPSNQDFFLEYARAIIAGGPLGFSPTKEAGNDVRAFISAVAALENLGERNDDGTLVRIAFDTDEHTRRSQTIIGELGLKLVPAGNGYALEPGDHPDDGYRQWALAGFGVDELDLRRAVQQKKEFTFEIPRENARLVGGSAWGLLLKGVPDVPGGPIGIFTKDWRFARVYSGLGAMDDDSAAALVSSIGLANLIIKYSTLMADYGDAIALADKHVAVPGGAKAEPVWAKLAGANPQNPGPFFRALFEKDQGRLLAFYHDLAHADATHQQYFTLTPERSEAFYKWYRDSTAASTASRQPDRWQAKILQSLRIDGNGKVLFPGGREAWTSGAESDDEILLHRAPLEAMAALVTLEGKRGAPMSAASAQLITQRYSQWRSLMPYFEQLPGLDVAEFHALADFTDDAAKVPANRRNALMGEWHSLAELIVLGVRSGALTNTQAAQFFREACDDMRAPDASTKAVATLRSMAGNGDPDEALAARLLRLTGPRREAFEEVKRLQQVPPLASLGEKADAGKTLAALSGAVYAAVLDPACLLVAEDAQLLSRHSFTPAGTLFAPTSLSVSSGLGGTNFEGGFESFAEKALPLRKQRVGELLPDPDKPRPPFPPPDGSGGPDVSSGPVPMGPPPPPPPPEDVIFRAGGRMVEVYATVTDGRGHYIDDLSAGQFGVLENGQAKPVLAFENHNAPVSVALVFDASGSMVNTLPPLKLAALQLVDELRPADSVAVYSFNDSVAELQPFTSEKENAERAILRTHPTGITSLYDALVRVNHDLAGRGGKKVIIVFSDGSDNASMLSASAAIDRAKARGVPIYTIAEGDALTDPQLVAELNNISQATGGTPFLIRRMSDIGGVFEKVSQDLLHGYLVAFQPSPGDNREWRKIDVVLDGAKGLQARAREGFYVE